ncbi:hypothetical protein F4809DRAFT_640736 [Biscogniauxia mediterranea]|nr:hypothetical protein F4809DRAFT_640736 [Biscogniauxia mediterranea]
MVDESTSEEVERANFECRTVVCSGTGIRDVISRVRGGLIVHATIISSVRLPAPVVGTSPKKLVPDVGDVAIACDDVAVSRELLGHVPSILGTDRVIGPKTVLCGGRTGGIHLGIPGTKDKMSVPTEQDLPGDSPPIRSFRDSSSPKKPATGFFKPPVKTSPTYSGKLPRGQPVPDQVPHFS